MTEQTPPSATPTLAALVPCRAGAAAGISESLLSLAAQTNSDFEVHVIVEGGSSSETNELSDLVATFDEDFNRRVHIVALDTVGSGSAIAFGVARTKAQYIAVLYPDDVVFAHWAETFKANASRADGQAMASMVGAQRIESTAWGDERIVTTIERPRFPDPVDFDLMEYLVSPPLSLRGWAFPRLTVQGVLGQGIPAEAEGWALRLAAGISCGVLPTGEVTYLCRSSEPAIRPAVAEEEWERDRGVAMDILDQSGMALAPGLLRSLRNSPTRALVRQLEEELHRLRAELRAAQELGRHQAAAEVAARQRAADLLASTSWKATAPLRALGGATRRLRRKR